MNAEADRALAAYDLGGPATKTPVTIGLINVTYRVEAPAGTFALQRLNPIFGRGVHQDIEAVTRHLATRGLETPRLVRTRRGDLDVSGDAHPWRLMTWVDGETVRRVDAPARAEAAGELLGRFHAAVADLEHEFVNARLGVHDTPRHLALLEAALETHGDHPLYADVAPRAQSVLQTARHLAGAASTADRVVHGDPKLDNLIFDPATGAGRCMVDLDTLARMPVGLELGDAFRSWCNPAGEDTRPPQFDLGLFAAALAGYAHGSGGLLSAEEREGLVAATATIMLELSSRFLRDALEENYFGWDPTRFSTRGEHNLYRGEVQAELAESLLGRRAEAERLVRAA